jgi:hypothetical protein
VWSCAVLNHKPTKFLDEIDAWVAEQTAKFEAEKLESEKTTGALKGPLPWRAWEDEPSASNPKPSDDVKPSQCDNEETSQTSFLDNHAESTGAVVSEVADVQQDRASEEPVPTTSGRSALEELSGQVDELAGKVNELVASLRSPAKSSDGQASVSESSERASEYSQTSTTERPLFSRFFGIGAGNPFSGYGALHVANLAWAYAVLGETRRPAFARLWEEVERKQSVAFDDRMMSQLWQVHLTLKLEESDLVSLIFICLTWVLCA